jgi:hypothetical protein
VTMLMDAKTLIGPPVDASGNYDGLLEDIIAGILAGADEFMEASVQKVEDAEAWFDGGTKTLYLPHFNVSHVSVYEDGIIISDLDYAVYPGTGVAAGKIVADTKFRQGNRSVKVVYDGGYEEDDFPASLRRKLLKQVSYEFRRRSDPGLSSVSYPDGSVQKFSIGEWLPDVEAELLRRRRIFL